MQTAGRADVFQSLQLGRAAAAVLVVLSHAGSTLALDKYLRLQDLGAPYAFGRCGVEFFFLLSGFIIYWVHHSDISNPSRALSFALKRVIRIYPAYWIVFFLVYCVAIFIPSAASSLPTSAWSIAHALSLFPAGPSEFGGNGSPVLVVAWTLQYEVFFYSIFFLGIVNFKAGLIVGSVVIASSIFLSDRNTLPSSFIAPNWIFLFLFGVVLAFLTQKNYRFTRPALMLTVAMIALLILAIADAFDTRRSWAIDPPLAFGLLCCPILVSLLNLEQLGFPVSGGGFLQLVGRASYSIYLVHFPVVSAFSKIISGLIDTNSFLLGHLLVLLCTAVCMIAGIIFHLSIEKPITALLNRFFFKPGRLSKDAGN